MAGKLTRMLSDCERNDSVQCTLELGEVMILKLLASIYCTSDFENAIISILLLCLSLSLKLVFNFSGNTLLQIAVISIFADIFHETNDYFPEILYCLQQCSLISTFQKKYLSTLLSLLENLKNFPAHQEWLALMHPTPISIRSIDLRGPLQWRVCAPLLSSRKSGTPREDTICDTREKSIMFEYNKMLKAANSQKKAAKRDLQKMSYSLMKNKYEKEQEKSQSRRNKRQKNLVMLEDENI